MTRPNAILKAAAVGCSVLLAAGFVSYRAGAFDWLNPPAPEPTPVVETPGPAAAAKQTDSPSELVPQAVLSSSKSAIIVTPSAPPPAGSTAGAAPQFIGGSKSLAPLIPSAPRQPASPPAQAPGK